MQMYLKQNCAQIAGTLENKNTRELIKKARAIEAYITDIEFDVPEEPFVPEVFPEVVEDPDQLTVDLDG